MTDGLIALASLAGQTVVTAAASDAWEAAKRGFARLLGRGDPKRTQLAEQRLEDTRKQLTEADPGQVGPVLAARWATRLADLLEENPEVAADLRALVREVQAQGTAAVVSATDHAVAAGRDINVSADRGGVAATVIHGSVGPPNPTGPGPANG